MSTNVLSPKKGVGGESQTDYTEHIEPLSQGGKRYVRCEGCGRELLVDLGGRERLVHRDGCSNA
jgi:hypothetical protein